MFNALLVTCFVAVLAANTFITFPMNTSISVNMLFLWVGALLALIYCYLPQRRFKRTGVKYLNSVPLLGDMTKVLFGMQHVFDNIDRVYCSFPKERFFGLSEFIRPVLVIRDLELVKKIAVKDFEHFQDHSLVIDEHIDPMFGRSIFIKKGQDWKDIRSLMSPVFTSLKLKKMVQDMEIIGNRMVGEIKTRIQDSKTNCLQAEFGDFCSQYIFEIIAYCAFGIKADPQDSSNVKFYNMEKKLSKFGYLQLLGFLGFSNFPLIMKAIRATMFSKSSQDFFKKLSIQTIATRKAQNIKRPDLIDIIMEARKDYNFEEDATADTDGPATANKTAKKAWKDDDLLAQPVLLLMAGFDPVAGALTQLVHELAINPEVQGKLAQEILETDRRSGGRIDLATIQQMTYMEMVISEMLRKWANSNVDRLCTKDYNLGRPNDSAAEDYIIRKGEGLYIPMKSIHFDPQYYPEPNKFDPERFSKENRPKIPAFAYNPFGIGQRACMGVRFATVVMKVLTYQLVRDLEISSYEKTTCPIQLNPAILSFRSLGGTWVRMTLRQ